MTKEEIAQSCKVPATMANDPYEPITQAEFTKGLLAAIKSLGLSKSELEDVRDGKVSDAELRAMIVVL